MGFDVNLPFAVLMDGRHNPFVVDDISKLPKELLNKVSKEAHDEIMRGGRKADWGQIISKHLRKNLASTHNGVPITHLNTWVNDGHDPYRRPVKLPPPAALQGQAKKGNAMFQNANQHPSFPVRTPVHMGQQVPQGMTPAAHVQAGHRTGVPFAPGQPFGPNQAFSTTHGVLNSAPAPQVQIPSPDKVVTFHLGGGSVQSRYHFADVVEQDTSLDGQSISLRYVVLIRNNAAAAAGDQFVPVTPAPGAFLGVTLPDGNQFQIHSVLLSYSVKTTSHTILLVMPEAPQPDGTGQEYQQEGGTDPLGGLGEPAPAVQMMDPEDAAQAV